MELSLVIITVIVECCKFKNTENIIQENYEREEPNRANEVYNIVFNSDRESPITAHTTFHDEEMYSFQPYEN